MLQEKQRENTITTTTSTKAKIAKELTEVKIDKYNPEL